MSYDEAKTRFYLIDGRGRFQAQLRDAAVYDLKAVNPRTHIVRDNRTSAEIIESIASHGRSVDPAFARLKALLAADPTPASGD